ncbi:hypothetical protein LR48_Vigan03g202600 [Vigna angularis]|uniref:MULE transposase domain-containing protein n=1 Tax=Phaseolus angularis TaxID=3914 RepID=A0A0L9U857_PHAAN|nr:uncharacterized protein HKW66_Vig0046990 [Vigna angularis]KOM38644.1 hypothetical protein LR48_Vigan03g202600 [Vigna angularis]
MTGNQIFPKFKYTFSGCRHKNVWVHASWTLPVDLFSTVITTSSNGVLSVLLKLFRFTLMNRFLSLHKLDFQVEQDNCVGSQAAVPVVAPIEVIVDADQCIDQVEFDVSNDVSARSICCGVVMTVIVKLHSSGKIPSPVWAKAFAVVDTETEDNWCWFLQELKLATLTSKQITFVADFQDDQKSSHILEKYYHSCGLRHLAEKSNKDSKGQFSQQAKWFMINDLLAARSVH